MRQTLKTAGFRLAHRGFHEVAVPLGMRLGPLEPMARALALRAAKKPANMEGIPNPLRTPDGFTIHHTGEPSGTIRAVASAEYEPETRNYISRTLKPGEVFIDVGAHVGIYTLVAARAVGPAGRVWAFEPDVAIADCLEANVQANRFTDRVSVVRSAVGVQPGVSEMYRFANDTGSSSLYRRSDRITATRAVPVVTLDGWSKEARCETVRVIKIDIEGAEVDALKGMTELISRSPEVEVIVELNPEALESAGETPATLRAALRDVGLGDIHVVGERRSRPFATIVREARWRPLNLLARRAAAR